MSWAIFGTDMSCSLLPGTARAEVNGVADQDVKVSFLDFLKTGSFGAVRLGMTQGELQACIGAPQDTSIIRRKQKRPEVFKYGSIEFHFDAEQDALWMIFLDHFVVPEGYGKLFIDPWIVRRDLSLEVLVNELRAQGISYTEEQEEISQAHRVTTSGGVKLSYFPIDDPDCCFLEAVYYSQLPGMT